MKRAYRLLASTELRLTRKLEELESLDSRLPALLVEFIESSSRGICSFSR